MLKMKWLIKDSGSIVRFDQPVVKTTEKTVNGTIFGKYALAQEHKTPVVAHRSMTAKGSFVSSVHMDDSQKSLNKASDS